MLPATRLMALSSASTAPGASSIASREKHPPVSVRTVYVSILTIHVQKFPALENPPHRRPRQPGPEGNIWRWTEYEAFACRVGSAGVFVGDEGRDRGIDFPRRGVRSRLV
jgi:hypothetical protein